MDLEPIRLSLIEQYVDGGYDRARAETVVNMAVEIHANCITHRVQLSQIGCARLDTTVERIDCLSTLLHLEIQHATQMLGTLMHQPPETIQ